MTVAKKGKRKIVVNEREFFWYVAEDLYEIPGGYTLFIVSEDKHFLVRYPLNQPENRSNYLIVERKEFGGNGRFGGPWQRVVCPSFDKTDSVTPAIIREIILWSLSEKKNIFIDWRGNQIS